MVDKFTNEVHVVNVFTGNWFEIDSWYWVKSPDEILDTDQWNLKDCVGISLNSGKIYVWKEENLLSQYEIKSTVHLVFYQPK